MSCKAFNFNCTVPKSISYAKSIFNLIVVCNVVTSSMLDNEHLSFVLNIVPYNSYFGWNALSDEVIYRFFLL